MHLTCLAGNLGRSRKVVVFNFVKDGDNDQFSIGIFVDFEVGHDAERNMIPKNHYATNR